MRRIIMFNRISADGLFSDVGGGLDWTVPDPDLDRYVMSGEGKVDTFLFGRRTYEMFASFWPHVTPDSRMPHSDAPLSPDVLKMAQMLNETPKLVFSTTLKEPKWQNTRVLPSIRPDDIAKMKDQRGDDMMIFGSGSVVAKLTEHGLIDEYQIVLSPVVLGAGARIFEGLPNPVRLSLSDAKTFPSGNILLRYAPETDDRVDAGGTDEALFGSNQQKPRQSLVKPTSHA